ILNLIKIYLYTSIAISGQTIAQKAQPVHSSGLICLAG
ncbi:unnamed protein product, partial [marine sediment metagenome]